VKTRNEAEDDIRVVEGPNGWDVVSSDGQIISANFKNNAEAWAWTDRFAYVHTSIVSLCKGHVDGSTESQRKVV
jgi:hypothetical protein